MPAASAVAIGTMRRVFPFTDDVNFSFISRRQLNNIVAISFTSSVRLSRQSGIVELQLSNPLSSSTSRPPSCHSPVTGANGVHLHTTVETSERAVRPRGRNKNRALADDLSDCNPRTVEVCMRAELSNWTR